MNNAITWAIVPVAIVVAVACTTDDTTTADPGTDVPASDEGAAAEPPPCGQLGEEFLSAACRDCAITSCCDELKACNAGAGAECSGVETCLGAACANQCAVSAGVCDTGVNLGSASCDACLSQSCCGAVRDCIADPTCSSCLLTGDGDCTASALLDDARNCAVDNCTNACDA